MVKLIAVDRGNVLRYSHVVDFLLALHPVKSTMQGNDGSFNGGRSLVPNASSRFELIFSSS